MRRQRIGQRVELDDLGAGGAQQFAVLGVAEAERLARRQRHGDVAADGRCDGRDPRVRRRRGWPRSAAIAGEVDVPADQCGHRLDRRARLLAVLDGGDQPEMP